MTTPYRVLMAETDIITALLCKIMLEDLGVSYLGNCTTSTQLQDFFSKGPVPDLLLLDAHLGGTHAGLVLHQQICLTHNLPTILLANQSDAWVAEYVRQHAHTALLYKPFSEDTLRASFTSLLSRVARK